MSETEKRLAAAQRAYLRREEERAFSNRSEDVRAWEPAPTKEIVAGWRTDEVPSMYATVRKTMDGDPWAPVPAQGKLSVF